MQLLLLPCCMHTSTPQLLHDLERYVRTCPFSAEVEWAVPDYIWELPPRVQPSSSGGGGGSGSSMPVASQAAGRHLAQAVAKTNDARYADQWHLPAISAPQAWARVGGAAVSCEAGRLLWGD